MASLAVALGGTIRVTTLYADRLLVLDMPENGRAVNLLVEGGTRLEWLEWLEPECKESESENVVISLEPARYP